MKLVKLILLLPVGLILSAWTSDRVNSEGVFTPVDPATELRLSIIFRDQSLHDLLGSDWKLATTQEYIEAVNRIGHRIAAAIAERPDLSDEWEFIVVEPKDPQHAKDPRWANAFAVGGGKVFVQSPLLEVLRINGKIDQDMLASILGHEMTHCVRSHIIQDMSISGTLDWLLSNLDDITSGKLTTEAKAKLVAAERAQFTRNQEAEADSLGALFATRAGYDGFGGAVRWMQWANLHMPTFSFEYLPGTGSGSDDQGRLLDHPTWEDRLSNLLRYKDQIAILAGEFNWGYFALQNFDFERAAVCFGDVVKIFPNSYEAENNLGLAYHFLYLRTAGTSEKFQPGLMNCFISFRDRVRGESTLSKAIEHYRRALALNPHAIEPQANLAVALSETNEPEDLSEAEAILQKLLAKYPSDPRLLNDMAIVLYRNAPSGTERGAALVKVAALFQKAWDQSALEPQLRLPALFNLGRLEIETGQKPQGVSHLLEYLKNQSIGPWAELAQHILKQENAGIPNLAAQSSVPIKDILSVAPGMTASEVTKILGEPDRAENAENSDGDNGQILNYRTLGISVVLVEDKVVSVNVFTPEGVPSVLQTSGGRLGIKVAGIELDETVDVLRKTLGEPLDVTHVPDTGNDNYFYAGSDGKTILKIRVYLGKVAGISLISRKSV